MIHLFSQMMMMAMRVGRSEDSDECFSNEDAAAFEIGALKPEFAIYQYAINTYQLDPTSTVYIDDQPQNIISGKELGFKCWQYDLNDHQAFEIWLEKTLTRR